MGGGSKQSSESSSAPGTLSPVTATLFSLFGGQPGISKGQYVPTSFGQGGYFAPGMFGALPGLLANMPPTGVENTLTASPQFQQQGYENILNSQALLNLGGAALMRELGQGTDAAVTQARRGFEQQTIPTILERAPGFSSSDLQRELTRAGADLETNVAAMREQSALARSNLITQSLPQFAQTLGTNLVDQASQLLGYGTLSREFMRDTSPAGDAFRVLTALQSLTGPGLTNVQVGTSKGKSTQVL